jgi:calmodulin-regulated spectrin-associated protein
MCLFALQEIARSTAKHFLILFRDAGCQYRGLYSFDPDSEEAYKIVGVGPRQLTSEMVEKFYK